MLGLKEEKGEPCDANVARMSFSVVVLLCYLDLRPCRIGSLYSSARAAPRIAKTNLGFRTSDRLRIKFGRTFHLIRVQL